MKPISKVFTVVLVIVIAASLVITAAVAQGRKGQGGQGVIARDGSCIAAGVDLTEQQKAQIQNRLQTCRQQCLDIRNSNLTPEQKQAQIVDLRQACRNDVSQMLTPEQRERAKQFWAERKCAFGGKLGRPGMAARGGYGLEQLDLTQAQKDRIAAIRQDSLQQVQAIRLDTTLTPQQKTERIAAIRNAGHEQVLQVLTPEQRQKLEEWRASSPRAGQKKAGVDRPGAGTRGRGMMRNPGPWCPVVPQ